MKIRFLVTALSILVLCWPKTAAAQCSTFGGRATVVQANGLGIVPVVLSDTGNINSSGGINDASLLNASVPGLLSGEVLSATAGSVRSSSQSVASMANVNLTVAGNTIGAGFAVAHANAACTSGGPTVNGSTEIDRLVVNGLSVVVTGSPNQIVPLLGGGYIILNEQTSSVGPPNGSITVNAIHVTVPGVADMVIASAFAAVSGQLVGASGGPRLIMALLLQVTSGPCPIGTFFTGGGWIIATDRAKGTFGVSGGYHRNVTLFGHLEYVDHGNPMINVHGTGVTSCFLVLSVTGMGTITTGTITGTARVNGQSGCTYTVTVTDDDTPGGIDMFGITLAQDNSPGAPTCLFLPYSAGPGPLGGGGPGGGDIEFHRD